MRRFVWVFGVATALFLAGACKASQPQPEYRVTATIKDIMDSEVDKSADVLWESVATIVSAAGTEERQPRTDEEWATVHRSAVELTEATNLLLMPGRLVAKPGQKSDNPGIELAPEEIDKLINDDRPAWVNFAHALHDAAVPALKATEDRNAQALLDAGEKIDTACENCHLKYWYPLSKQAEVQKSGAASPRKQ